MVIDWDKVGETASERWMLAWLAGVLNGAGFVFWGPASLIANVPLLLALRKSHSSSESAGLGALVGAMGGVHIYGILNYGWFLLIGFSVYTASQMVVYALLFRALWCARWSWTNVVLPAALWGLSEWLRTVGPLSMPASYVGNIADTAWLRPWLNLAALTGGLGVSTLVAMVQGIIFTALIGDRANRRVALGVGILLLALGAGGALMQDDIGDKQVRVIAVQGGLANAQYHAAQADPAAMSEVIRTYEQLTQDAYAKEPDFVLWPETAVRAPVLQTPALRNRLFPPEGSRSILLAGLVDTDLRGRRYNVIVAAGEGGKTLDRYAKVRLVPGTESHFTPGLEFTPIVTPVAAVGAMICLESVYPYAAKELVAAGAEFLVVSSNDAGFGWSPITEHMTNRAIVRAVETGRWLIRSGQAGVSTVISPSGKPLNRLGLFKPGLLEATIWTRSDTTLFVKWGQWWIWIVMLVLGLSGWMKYSRYRSDSTDK